MNLQKLLPSIFFTLLTFSNAFALDNVSGIQITPLLKTTTSWNGTPIQYPEGQAEITGVTITIAPGVESGWHTHPAPSFGVVLEGELDIMLKTGETKHLKVGIPLLRSSIRCTPAKIMAAWLLNLLCFMLARWGKN